jgi:hypothetical protein
MPKERDGEDIARVLGGPDVSTAMETLGDVPVEKRGQADVYEEAMVEGVVLEDHDVRDDEGTLQPRMVHVAESDAPHCEEALPELWMKVRGDDVGRGEAAGDGGRVELAREYATVEVWVVGRVEEIVEEAACEHEGKEGARRRGGRVVVQGKDDAVFHQEEEREGHGDEEGEETREGQGCQEGYKRPIRSFRQSGVLGRTRSWGEFECDSDEPVSAWRNDDVVL